MDFKKMAKEATPDVYIDDYSWDDAAAVARSAYLAGLRRASEIAGEPRMAIVNPWPNENPYGPVPLTAHEIRSILRHEADSIETNGKLK